MAMNFHGSGGMSPPTPNRFIATLSPADRALLEPSLKIITLEQGKILYEQGGDIDQVYFPHSGMISVVALLDQGDKIVEVATIGREGAVGLVAGFGPTHAFNRAIIQVTGVMSEMETGALQSAVKKSDTLRDHIVRYNELLLAQIQQGVACNAYHEGEARLCRWLLQTRDRIDTDVIPLTQEFLSEMLGVRRTTVTLIARTLQNRDLVRYRRGKIEILDHKGLQENACECYETIKRRTNKYFPIAENDLVVK
jgi:CRP-like cAMP-binding protein